MAAPSDTPFWIAQDQVDFPVPELDPVPPLMQFDVQRFVDLTGYNAIGLLDRIIDDANVAAVVGGLGGAVGGFLSGGPPVAVSAGAIGFIGGGIAGAVGGALGYFYDGGGPPDGPHIGG